MRCVGQWSRFIKPFEDGTILRFVQLQLYRLQRFNIFDVFGPRQWRLLIVERWEPHSLEVSPVALLPPHCNPHRRPLGVEDRFDDSRYLIDQGQTSIDVIKHLDLSSRLPRHGHVFQQLQYGVRHELERSQIASLITAELLLRYISNILDNFSEMFRWHICLLCFHESTLSLLPKSVPLRSQPFLLLLRELRDLRVCWGSISRWRRSKRHRRSSPPSWRWRRW